MRSSACVWLAVLFLMAGACAEVPLSTSKYNSAAKRFKRPPMDRTNIYVYEASNGPKVTLYLDGTRVTTVVGYTFIVLPVRPGSHTLVAKLEGRRLPDPKNNKDAELEFYVGGGMNYFVEQEVMGVGLLGLLDEGEVSLGQVDTEQGKEGVRKCTLLADVPPALPPPVAPE